MPHLYDRFMEQCRILDSENRPVEDTFSQSMIWLENLLCGYFFLNRG